MSTLVYGGRSGPKGKLGCIFSSSIGGGVALGHRIRLASVCRTFQNNNGGGEEDVVKKSSDGSVVQNRFTVRF